MIAGFHTISFLLHDEVTAIEQLAGMGFRAAAIRPRLSGLNLNNHEFPRQAERITRVAAEHQIQLVIDLSGMFLSDPMVGPSASLSSADENESRQAADTIEKWIEVSEALRSTVMTIPSGTFGQQADEPAAEPSVEPALERLAKRLEPLICKAQDANVKLAIRPTSSNLIATVAQYERFLQWLGPQSPLAVAPDIGEMLLSGEFPVGERLARHQRRLACVYLCEPESVPLRDQRIGHGDIDLHRVWEAIEASGFDGPAIFRVCGHSELGFQLAVDALELLPGVFGSAKDS